jgi:hypothetical protein
VIHRSSGTRYRSDADLLAIRLPFVFEPIGGQADDWDSSLLGLFDSKLPIVLICEVKSGKYQTDVLFSRENMSYVIGRFGFTPDHQAVVDQVCTQAITVVPEQFQIGKILFSYARERNEDGTFLHVHITNCEDFIIKRIQKYTR